MRHKSFLMVLCVLISNSIQINAGDMTPPRLPRTGGKTRSPEESALEFQLALAKYQTKKTPAVRKLFPDPDDGRGSGWDEWDRIDALKGPFKALTTFPAKMSEMACSASQSCFEPSISSEFGEVDVPERPASSSRLVPICSISKLSGAAFKAACVQQARRHKRSPSHDAARNGNVEELKRIIAQPGSQEDIHKCAAGETILELCARRLTSESAEMVTSLLEAGVDPNKCGESKRNALHWMCTTFIQCSTQEQVEACQKMLHLLFKAGINFNAPDIDGNTPLSLLEASLTSDAVQLIGSIFAQYGASLTSALLNKIFPDAIVRAAALGMVRAEALGDDAQPIEKLIADRLTQNPDLVHAMISYAAGQGRVETVQYLLSHGANPLKKNNGASAVDSVRTIIQRNGFDDYDTRDRYYDIATLVTTYLLKELDLQKNMEIEIPEVILLRLYLSKELQEKKVPGYQEPWFDSTDMAFLIARQAIFGVPAHHRVF